MTNSQPTNERFHCSECRKDLSATEYKKQPLGYTKTDKGTLTPNTKRFALFCKICGKFLLILDLTESTGRYKTSSVTNPGTGSASL